MSGMSKRSILVKPEIDKLLHVAKECIEHEQALQQMLFLHVAGDQLLQMPLTLTGDAEATGPPSTPRHRQHRQVAGDLFL